MVNENVEKFLFNYKDYIDCIKEHSHIADKKEKIAMIINKLKTKNDN